MEKTTNYHQAVRSSAHTEEHIEKTIAAFHTVFEKLSTK